MKRPFNIFPTIGYRNSQFQVVSSVNDLRIDIFKEDNIIQTIKANSEHPLLLTSLNTTGKLVAKCKTDNTLFQQEIEVKEAFRLGSSVYKKAFVFDDTDFSFFLMKDRLLLYDEKKKILLTENHYSPTEIYKINNTNFLFVTKVGSSGDGIINLGIYNIDTFSLVGELINDYREIKILPDSNIAWLYNAKSNTIHCYELAHQTNKYFTELNKYYNFNDYCLDDIAQNIYINYNEIIKFSNLSDVYKVHEIIKKANNAIDKLGNMFTVDNNLLTCTSILTNYSEEIKIDFKVNFQNDKFIHIGNDLKSKDEFIDLNKVADEIKDEVVTSLSDTNTYHYYNLPELKRISETQTTHRIYPTTGGVFIIQMRIKRDFKGVTFKKHQNNWTHKPYTIENSESTLLLFFSGKVELLVDKTPHFKIIEYHNSMLLLENQKAKLLISGSNRITLAREDSIKLFTVNKMGFCLIKSNEKYSLFRSNNLNKAILDQIEILNPNLIEQHGIIWYRGIEKYVSKTKYLSAFDLNKCKTIFIDEKKMQHSIFKDALQYTFFENYAFSSTQVIFNPATSEVKDAFVGIIESYSKQLNKIVSRRAKNIYLSIFNPRIGKYVQSEISVDDKKYKESYLSPDGQFLVLQDESNRYAFYNIENNEIISFLSGNFLGFRSDGSLIVEQDGTRVEQDSTRAVKIIDQKTFQDIPTPNYQHYRFMSPDSKLYAQVSSKIRYFNKLNGKELKVEEVVKFRQDLDEPDVYLEEVVNALAKMKVDKNRQQIFSSFKEQFLNLGIDVYTKITSKSIVKIEKYVEIGVIGTNIVKEVVLPEDTQFYNYASFNYDSRFLGMVFRLGTGGGILFIKLKFDEKKTALEIIDTYLSRYPRYASWVCGFSRSGYFATYDSTPDTYIINVAENLFKNKPTEIELRQNIYKTKTNIYHTYNQWNEIKGKNFLCFSPTGDYLALSEQGYEPLTLGGYGHQESNVVHIALTNSGQIIDSFTGHGDEIKDNKTKKVTFVAFSEDESRIMTLSSDGVVIIRDIHLGGYKNNQNLRFNKFDWDFVILNRNFINQLFSTFYEFSELQLTELCNKLSLGCQKCNSDAVESKTIFGLIYNTKIKWTENIRKLYYKEPVIIYAGDGTDVYSYDWNFDQLPLDVFSEIECIKSSLIYDCMEMDNDHETFNAIDELKEKFLQGINKQIFTDEDILTIIERKNIEYFANPNFFNKLIEKLHNDISDFTIEMFYSKIDK